MPQKNTSYHLWSVSCLQNLDRNLDKKSGNNNVVWWKLWWEAQSRDTQFGLWVCKFNNSTPKFTCFSWFLLSCWSSKKPWQWEQLNFKISGLRDPKWLHGPASGSWNITNLRLADEASEARESWNWLKITKWRRGYDLECLASNMMPLPLESSDLNPSCT